MKKLFLICIIICIMTSCADRKKSCFSDFETLVLPPVNAVVQLPHYIILDTIAYGDSDNIFGRELRTRDSSMTIYADIKSYEKRPEAMPSFDLRMEFEKNLMASLKIDSLQLVTETFKREDTTIIGYLKYFNNTKKEFEGSIFFNRGNIFTRIVLSERFTGKESKATSVMDCVFKSVKLNVGK